MIQAAIAIVGLVLCVAFIQLGLQASRDTSCWHPGVTVEAFAECERQRAPQPLRFVLGLFT